MIIQIYPLYNGEQMVLGGKAELVYVINPEEVLDDNLAKDLQVDNRKANVARLVFRRTEGAKKGQHVVFPMNGKKWFYILYERSTRCRSR